MMMFLIKQWQRMFHSPGIPDFSSAHWEGRGSTRFKIQQCNVPCLSPKGVALAEPSRACLDSCAFYVDYDLSLASFSRLIP